MLNYCGGEKSKTGTLRFYCPRCKKSFSSYQKKSGKRKSALFWFEKYVLKGITYETLADWSGLTVQALFAQFQKLFKEDPPLLIIPQVKTEEAYLLIDGLWFGKRLVLLLYRQAKGKVLLHASFMAKEYGTLIAKDLLLLKEKGYRFTGVVSDGGTGIRKAVFRILGHIPHQICLAHLHRDVINAIGRFPKDERTRELKKLADWVWKIESREALRWWEEELQSWITKNKSFLNETQHLKKGGWWFIHKGVRKAVGILVSLPYTSFKFLDRPLMPKTSNAIEGSISVLSRKEDLHKGLKRENLKSFLNWFIYFYNRKLLSQRKTKKAGITNTKV